MRYDPQSLIRTALSARKLAYVPYSHYAVGAALLCPDGTVYSGCNIENASYPVCCCAERAALFSAVAQGQRRFSAIAVVGGNEHETAPLREFAYPCGVCRQALLEFGWDIKIIVAKSETDYNEHVLRDLLPHGFSGAAML